MLPSVLKETAVSNLLCGFRLFSLSTNLCKSCNNVSGGLVVCAVCLYPRERGMSSDKKRHNAFDLLGVNYKDFGTNLLTCDTEITDRIRRIGRRGQMQVHPDKSDGDAELSEMILRAVETLSNPILRTREFLRVLEIKTSEEMELNDYEMMSLVLDVAEELFELREHVDGMSANAAHSKLAEIKRKWYTRVSAAEGKISKLIHILADEKTDVLKCERTKIEEEVDELLGRLQTFEKLYSIEEDVRQAINNT